MIKRPIAAAWVLLFGLAMALGADAAQAAGGGALTVPPETELDGLAASRLIEATSPSIGADELSKSAADLADRFEPVDYEPALRAGQLGPGVEPAFEYVRDHVRFEAYPGVLRGAKGAYMSQAGNALDRSLLLAELLKQKGIETRFARGKLPRAEAERLFERMFDAPEPSSGQHASTQDATGQAPAAREGGDAIGNDLLNRVRQRARRDYGAIMQALGDQRPTPRSVRSQVIDEITSHVWVQASMDGKWVDLDSAFADATPGQHYAEPAHVGATLPREMHQRVTMRITTERLEGGRLRSEKTLEVSQNAAELLEQQVFLVHAPVARGVGSGIAKALGAADPDAWVPVLLVGDAVHRGKVVRFNEQPEAAGDKPKSGLGGLFESLPTGDQSPDDPKPAPAGPVFVAEHLEFELSAPGRRPLTIRRVLVDRGAPGWRQVVPLHADTLRPLKRHDKQPAAAQIVHNVWFSAGRHNLSAYADAAAMLVPPENAGPDDAPRLTHAQQLWALSMQSLPAVLWGAHGLIPALNDDPSARFYADAPRIILFSFHGAPRGGEGLAIRATMDLLRDSVRGVARDDDDAVLRRKIWYGALAGAMEHELVAMQGKAVATGEVEVDSTSALLDDKGALVLRRADRNWQSRVADETTAARIKSALDAGQTLIVPVAALGAAGDAATGWWAIDAGGDTRAVLSDEIETGGISIRTLRGQSLQGQGPGRAYELRPGGRIVESRTPQYRPRGGASQEYITLLEAVSLPVSELWGTAVGRVVVIGATSGVAAVTALVGYTIGE